VAGDVVSELIVMLLATIIGGLAGYVAFWLRQNWDMSVRHLTPARAVMISLAVAGRSVFRGTLVGLAVGTLVVVLCGKIPW
jgi:ABC-type branched-subunit amino acid transport system permease subunit